MPSMYEAEIISRYQNPLFAGNQESSTTHSAEGVNLSCGDEVKIWVTIGGDGKIEKIRHETRGCAICTASTDIFCEALEGRPLGESLRGTDVQKHIAKLNIPLSPLRTKCASLPCHAFHNLAPLSPAQ